MPLTPQDVAGKVFGPTRMRRGYDENEVDAFLDEVEAELTRLTTDNERLTRELEQARRQAGSSAPSLSKPAPAQAAAMPEAPTSLEKTVEPSAEPAAPQADAPAAPPAVVPAVTPAAPAAAVVPVAADDVVVEHRVARMLVLAQQTADAAVREAEDEADRTRGEARAEAERMVSEARSRAAEEIGRLQRSKSALESEVEQLQSFERDYRQRLRAYLEMQLRELELEPGAAAALGNGAHQALGQATPAVDGSAPTARPGYGAGWGSGPASNGDPAAAGGSYDGQGAG